MLSSACAFQSEDWLTGIYFLPKVLRTAVIAINKLPRTPETLWLRIFGKGVILQQAIDEVIGFNEDDPRRSTILQLFATWKISIEASNLIEQEDREFIMTLSQAPNRMGTKNRTSRNAARAASSCGKFAQSAVWGVR